MREYLKKQIAIPQDHGSWVFILSPLIIGIFAGGNFNTATFNLIIAAMSAFMIRQPLTILVKIISGRRPKTDLSAALVWLLLYGNLTILMVIRLIREGFGYILHLAIPGIPVFIWYLWLVSRREERKRPGVEIIAISILSLVAPAAYWIGNNAYNSMGWWLWALCSLQNSVSIIHAYLRLEQREWKLLPNCRIRFRSGWQVLLFTSFNLLGTGFLGLGTRFLPPLIFIPFLVQWLESIWGIVRPAIGVKPTQIGFRQLIVSTLWTLLFIFSWRT